MRSPRNDLVKNYRVHPTHWLISTQVAAADAHPDAVHDDLWVDAVDVRAAEIQWPYVTINLCGNQPVRRVHPIILH